MLDPLPTIDDLFLDGQRVLLRVDLNVPLEQAPGGGVRVADDTRLRAALPTIDELRRRRARLILVSHLGRPKGLDPALSMRPVAERLAQLTGVHVTLAPDVAGPGARELAERLSPGDILLLENVRFETGETVNDPELAERLADLADVYINDAFATAHRAHASTVGVARLLPCAAGRLVEREVRTLNALTDHPRRPLVAILGGAKVSDKIGVVARFLQLADAVCIGGAMAFPFLLAQGHTVGASRCDDADLSPARCALAASALERCRLELPQDLLAATHPRPDVPGRALNGVDVPDGWMGLDIGPRTIAHYTREIAAAATVFWNGPMGLFELPPFAAGTRAIATAIAANDGVTVAGGGETAQAMRAFGLQDRVTHLSTGGGATLAFLEGHELPGLQALAHVPAGAR